MPLPGGVIAVEAKGGGSAMEYNTANGPAWDKFVGYIKGVALIDS